MGQRLGKKHPCATVQPHKYEGGGEAIECKAVRV